MLSMTWIDVLFAILGVIVTAVVGILGLIFGFKWFDRLTKDIKEIKEIEKGNIATAIFLGGVIISIAIVIYPGAAGMNQELIQLSGTGATWQEYGHEMIYGVLNMLIGIIVIVPTLYLVIKVEDWATKTIDEYRELKKGNTAVAILLFFVIVGIALIIAPSLNNLAQMINYQLF